jgi:hypothetical protein
MACSDVKLACCRLCKKPLASNLGECIHCGVCNPIEKETCSWWHRAIVILLVLGTILATLRYEARGQIEKDCQRDETGEARRC